MQVNFTNLYKLEANHMFIMKKRRLNFHDISQDMLMELIWKWDITLHPLSMQLLYNHRTLTVMFYTHIMQDSSKVSKRTVSYETRDAWLSIPLCDEYL